MERCSLPLSTSFAAPQTCGETSPSLRSGQRRPPPDGFWVNGREIVQKQAKCLLIQTFFFSLASHIVSKETLLVRLLLVLCVSLVYRGRLCGLGAAEGELQQLCR